jgi:hypothetical protein
MSAVPLRTFDEVEALTWLQAQSRVKISAAELGRTWGWPEHRVRRRLKAWKSDGAIRQRGKIISVAKPTQEPTPNPTPVSTPSPVLSSSSRTAPAPAAVSRSAFLVALALAAVSGSFAIYGLTSIFSGAFLPVIAMGTALEAGKLAAVSWLGQSGKWRHGLSLGPSSPW